MAQMLTQILATRTEVVDLCNVETIFLGVSEQRLPAPVPIQYD